MGTALTERQTGLSRRGLLAGVAALSLGATLPVKAGSTLAFDRFMAVSARLCDVPLFSRALGADILALLSHEFTDEKLNALIVLVEGVGDDQLDFRANGLGPLVSRLVALWYSGLAPMKSGNELVLSYTDVAAWPATGYAKPPSYCGVAFGEWSQAPDMSATVK